MSRIQQIEDFLKETPNDPFLHYALTMEYVKIGDTAKSLLGFENLVEKYPDYVGTYYHFGKFLEKENDSARAQEIYQIGIQVATKMRNMHAKGELMGALNMLLGFDEDEDC